MDNQAKVVECCEMKQGRTHGYPGRVQVGRGSDGEGRHGIWAGAVSSKRGPTDRPTDQTDGRTKRGVESRSTRLKRSQMMKSLQVQLLQVAEVAGFHFGNPINETNMKQWLQTRWKTGVITKGH